MTVAAHERDCTCFRCKCLSISVSDKATPNRAANRNNTAVPRDKTSSNAWERGVKTDHRGMPYLHADGSPIGLKEWSEKKHTFEAAIKANAAAATTTHPERG